MSAISLVEPKKLYNTAFGASLTDEPLAEFAVDSASALNFRADIVCSSVTVGGGISVKLQSRAKGGVYTDLATGNASVSVTGNGTVSIVLHVQRAADQADLPLRKHCRLVLTTGAGSAVTVDEITVQQQ